VIQHAHPDRKRAEGPRWGEDEAAGEEEIDGAEEDGVVLDPKIGYLERKDELGGVWYCDGKNSKEHVMKTYLKSLIGFRVVLYSQAVEEHESCCVARHQHVRNHSPSSQSLVDQLQEYVHRQDGPKRVLDEVQWGCGLGQLGCGNGSKT